MEEIIDNTHLTVEGECSLLGKKQTATTGEAVGLENSKRLLPNEVQSAAKRNRLLATFPPLRAGRGGQQFDFDF